MRSRVSIFIVVVSVLALVAATGAFAAADRSMGRKGAFSPAAERLDGGTLALDMKVPYERAELILSGPGGVRVKREFAGGEAIALGLVDQAGAPLANGSYRYSLRISPRPENSSAVMTGMFFVRDGTAVSRQTRRAELGQTREALNLTRFERSKQKRVERRQASGQRRAGAVKGAPAEARPGGDPSATYDYYGTVAIWDTYPSLYFYANYGYGYYYAGAVYGESYYGYSLSSYGYIWNNVYAGYGTWVSAPYNYTTGYSNYDRALGYVYYGYLYGGFTTMKAFAIDYPYLLYSQYLVVNPLGVGVGTYFPTADLEVYDYNDYAALRLNNYNAIWAFSNTPGGSFTVNKIGSGGQEFSVSTRNNGAGVSTMKVQGTVEATGGFLNSSSRDVKTDFATLDSKDVLAKLAEVPVMSWRYKEDHQAARHAGPTAEDFQAAFQLGDGKTISTIDADGVALVAIQGLHSMLQEMETALEELRAEKDREIADLARRLAALEERLQAHLPGGS